MARTILAVAAGAGAYALALPPVDCPAFGWVALVPLLLVVRSRSPLPAAGWGAVAGFASGWAVTWWLAGAVSSYFAAGVLAGALAMSAAYAGALCTTFGLFAAGSAWLLRRDPWLGGRLAVAALWTALELVRARGLGQPWAMLGYTQHAVTPLVQLAAVTGVAGLSFVVAFANAGLAESLVRWWRGAAPGVVLRPLAAPAALAGVVALGGALVVPAPAPPASPAVRVALVQSNLPPAFRWTRAHAEGQLLANLKLTSAALPGRPDLIVWPENALGLYLEREPWVTGMLGRVARQAGAEILVGGPRWADGRTYNSARLLGRTGTIVAHYDKRRLVAFAEAPPIETAHDAAPSDRPSSFTPGQDDGLLHAAVPLAVSICQEALYPEALTPAVERGGAVLVNLANDGWLDAGHGVGSRQHAAMSAMRAVETRRWLVRAATTGVSMVVDPWGRVTASLAPGTAGVLEASVAPRDDVTVYVRFGDWMAIACPLLLLAVVHRGRRAGMCSPATPAPAAPLPAAV